MRRIDVAGTSSGAGKTTLVCTMLEALDGWAALKTSTHAERAARHGRPCLVTDPTVLATPGSDTARFLDHGAVRVAWLRATPETLERDLPGALATFADLPGLIVEGNSPWARVRGDRLVLVVGRDPVERVKRSAATIAADADLAVLDAGPARDGAERWLDQVAPDVERVRADLRSSGDPGLCEIVRRVVTWSRA